MKNSFTFKSGIDLSNQEELKKIYLYFDILINKDNNLINSFKFTKLQIDKFLNNDEEANFIKNPIMFNENNNSCKDLAFLYDGYGNIVGHIYSFIFLHKTINNLMHDYSIKTYDSYFPESIAEEEKNLLISDYINRRINNVTEYNIRFYEKIKK